MQQGVILSGIFLHITHLLLVPKIPTNTLVITEIQKITQTIKMADYNISRKKTTTHTQQQQNQHRVIGCILYSPFRLCDQLYDFAVCLYLIKIVKITFEGTKHAE